jgi:predicted DNA-binding transcriptional regulator AlpA
MEKSMETMQTDSEVRVERVRLRREVCDLLGVSASTLARLEASGEFPGRTKISERRYGCELPANGERRYGLFSVATPEYLRELEEQSRLVDYVQERFANFVEPEFDLLH